MTKETRGSEKARQNEEALRELSPSEVERIAGGLKLVRWFPHGTPEPFYLKEDLSQIVNPAIDTQLIGGGTFFR